MAPYLDVCRGCGKPRNAETTGTFVNPRGERVLRSRCFECTAAYRREWRRKTPTWEAVKARTREDYARRKAADPDLNRWREIRRNYGLSRADYDAMLAGQGSGCAACGGQPEGQRTVFEVDHCHRTGQIRGLLCGKCNRTLAMADDSIERLELLIEYLLADPCEHHPMVITSAPKL